MLTKLSEISELLGYSEVIPFQNTPTHYNDCCSRGYGYRSKIPSSKQNVSGNFEGIVGPIMFTE